MMWALIGSALLLIVLGALVRRPNWYWLISGYNTMSKEKKEKVDIKGLSAFLGNMLYLMAAIFLAASIAYLLDHPLIFLGIISLTFLQIIYMLIKAQKYDGNSKNPDGSYKLHVKLLIGFLIMVFIGVGALMYVSMLPVNIAVNDQYLQIEDVLYGRKVKWEEIEKVTLEDELPKIEARTNGASIGEIHKGNFRLEGKKRAVLFVVSNHPPYIFIERKQGLIIINDKDQEVTMEFYNRIMEKMKSKN
ncbi:MAG: DUF3784 domain-containing protein [Clostridia bacterium]|nr:DUF3784 domain-containing protein [Clostridia bacterium]